MRLGYRSDIDGLRAIAVGYVVLFHARIPPFRGGFVGVDVLFVITGFLITAGLVRALEAGGFSFADFYDRRIRRIFPALFVMLAGVTPLAALVLLPNQLMDYARTLTPAVLFYANLHFEAVLKYFALSMEEVPLLHLWALAIVEQFYIVFPVLLLGLLRLGGRKLAVGALVLVAAASLVYAQMHVADQPKVAFYPLTSRAWELVVGAVLALMPLSLPRPLAQARAPLAAAMGGVGLAAIVLPVLLYDKDMVFPGLAAVPPVLGAALLLHAGALAPHSYLTRALSLPAMTYVGRLSFGLYLWHWPLLLLASIYKSGHLTYIQSGLVILLAGVLAALSQRYVERPQGQARLFGGRRLARLGAAVGAILCVVGAARALEAAGGQLWPVSPRGAAALAALEDRSHFQTGCNNPAERWAPPLRGVTGCAIGPGAAQGTFDVLVWGDSHAGSAFVGIGEAVAALGHTARLLTMPGCPPLIGGSARQGPKSDESCMRFDAAVMEEIRRTRPKLVILVGRWTIWTVRARAGFALSSPEIPGGEGQSLESSQLVFAHMVDRTLKELAAMGTQVILLGQAPEYMFEPTHCVAQREYFGGDSSTCLTQSRAETFRLIGFADAVLKRIVPAYPNTTLFLQSDLFCKDDACSAGSIAPGHERFFYLDGDHLSATGARLAFQEPAFVQALTRALGAGAAAGQPPPEGAGEAAGDHSGGTGPGRP